MTPFEAVYGRKPPTVTDYIADQPIPAAVESTLLTRDTILRNLQANIRRAQIRMEQQANAHRLDKSFAVGEWVYIHLQPYRQTSVKSGGSNKLSKRFYGPFEITDRIGMVAYRVALPPAARIHNVFHVSLLRKCPDPTSAHTHQLPDSFIHFRPAPTPAEVLATRRIRSTNGCSSQLLIRWEGQPASDASWESLDSLISDFPSFDLEDKVVFDEGGNVAGVASTRGDHGREPGETGNKAAHADLQRRSSRPPMRTKRYPDTDYVH
ncbi:unnamed protein product [Rhodiola kirilowii]